MLFVPCHIIYQTDDCINCQHNRNAQSITYFEAKTANSTGNLCETLSGDGRICSEWWCHHVGLVGAWQYHHILCTCIGTLTPFIQCKCSAFLMGPLSLSICTVWHQVHHQCWQYIKWFTRSGNVKATKWKYTSCPLWWPALFSGSSISITSRYFLWIPLQLNQMDT